MPVGGASSLSENKFSTASWNNFPELTAATVYTLSGRTVMRSVAAGVPAGAHTGQGGEFGEREGARKISLVDCGTLPGAVDVSIVGRRMERCGINFSRLGGDEHGCRSRQNL